MVSYGGFSTADIYNSVINDVINGVKEAFLDDDIDLDVLQNIRKEWIEKIEAIGCVDKKPNRAHLIPPPIRTVGRVSVQSAPNTYQILSGQQVQCFQTADGTHLIPVQYTSGNHPHNQQPVMILQNPSLQSAPNTYQLDGNGARMSDSSSEDEDFDPLRRLVDKIGSDEQVPEEEEHMPAEEPPLNSDDDEEGENLDEVFDTENVVICQFDKVNRTRTKWKLNLKDGIMHINNRDHCFTKATGEATF